jgi:hypothetical protein
VRDPPALVLEQTGGNRYGLESTIIIVSWAMLVGSSASAFNLALGGVWPGGVEKIRTGAAADRFGIRVLQPVR